MRRYFVGTSEKKLSHFLRVSKNKIILFHLVRLPDLVNKIQDHQLNLNFRQIINNFV